MPGVEGVRQQVVELLIIHMSQQPLSRGLKVPAYRTVHNHTLLRNLGLKHYDGQLFARLLVKRKVCRPLGIHITAEWRTVEDVVASVIQHPLAK